MEVRRRVFAPHLPRRKRGRAWAVSTPHPPQKVVYYPTQAREQRPVTKEPHEGSPVRLPPNIFSKFGGDNGSSQTRGRPNTVTRPRIPGATHLYSLSRALALKCGSLSACPEPSGGGPSCLPTGTPVRPWGLGHRGGLISRGVNNRAHDPPIAAAGTDLPRDPNQGLWGARERAGWREGERQAWA